MTSDFIDPQLLNIPMNEITGHTRLHREDPPENLITDVEGWFAGTPKKEEANLQWARASYGTAEDELLQKFLNHGNIVRSFLHETRPMADLRRWQRMSMHFWAPKAVRVFR